jgi:hypothetical protein
MHDLDKFLDMLYESSGRNRQIEGINGILQLCVNIVNLEELIQNSILMGALTRILQEEHKRSVEIVFIILKIFLAFSNFAEMHDLMAEYKMGALTIKVSYHII